MIKRYQGDNWTMATTPTRVRLTERLSNGQYMNIWFWRQRAKGGGIDYIWSVGLYIGSKKGAALWRRTHRPSKRTGECGLEGLRLALGCILALARNLSSREELQIIAEDKARASAYRYLLRYDGFQDGGDNIITYRNPTYYYWEQEGMQ